jgi:hypothetical protein
MISKWLLWKRGLKGPAAHVLWSTTGGKPELLAIDEKYKISDLIPIAKEYEDYPIVDLMRIYPCPEIKED